MIRQLSLLGADGAGPEPGDLAGLLAGRGQISRAGELAQVSIAVDDPWRATVLVAECARRGVAATAVSAAGSHIGVRTAYCAQLTALAEGWTAGAVKRAPRDLMLDGRMLRLWAEAGGRFDGAGAYTLPLDGGDELHWAALGGALAAVGLAAQLHSPRSGAGASYRIVGVRRLGRLAEMIGDPPKQAPAGSWPR